MTVEYYMFLGVKLTEIFKPKAGHSGQETEQNELVICAISTAKASRE